ncbi:hypothetical protein QBC37DRAFT_422929 [Rhypophila decipiens]|uniref:gamma-glutamylcyclotransferase n=1 Tax=Rhypophila decipiens TaxID=261697 RepID=A0AAN7B7S7_9PEZI|nr:hypothetical protein QBC37DRAFT_422929 [Rhypophila decipiens]
MTGCLYFAYGSNLSLTQMAKRCPASFFHGRAVLPDYKWQINQRGFANIIPSPGNCVHGLVYWLSSSSDDEARLDRSEGVHRGCYSKVSLPMIVYPASDEMRTRRIVDRGGAVAVGNSRREKSGRMENNVLVYMSETYVQRGEPREEYIRRINAGIEDGVAMDIPKAFFENVVREYIPERSVPVSLLPQGSRVRSRSAVVEIRAREKEGRDGDEEYYSSDGYRYNSSTQPSRRSKSGGRWRDEVEDPQYDYQGRPLSTQRNNNYSSYYAPVIRTVSPDDDVEWYLKRSRRRSVL